MFGHANIFPFCSVPMKKLEIHFNIVSPESMRVLLIKGIECDEKKTAHTLKLVALSDPCFCILPDATGCWSLLP